MFTMLLEEEVREKESYGLEKAEKHSCYQFGPLNKGSKFEDLTDTVDIQRFPSKIENLMGRDFDLFTLV